MEKLPKIGFLFIMAGFVYITTQLLIRDVPLNLATWSLWVIIDTLLLISIISAGEKRPWAMIGFVTGVVVVTSLALIKLTVGDGQWSWGQTESLATICAVIALAVWKMTSGNGGVIAITIAMYVAMVPTFVDQWRAPIGQDPWFWTACSIGCALEFIGKPKTIPSAFFPAFGAFFNGLAAVLSFRQFVL